MAQLPVCHGLGYQRHRAFDVKGGCLVPITRQPSGVSLRPPRVVLNRTRKIGLCGAHMSSLQTCPWNDPSWELWGHASSRSYYSRELDRYFDLHPKSRWTKAGKKTALYPKWLAKNVVPIYMQEHFAEVPASIRYPKERILQEFRRYFTNHAAWMIALALTEGDVAEIGFFGVNYSHQSEYTLQRGSCEYWMGFAEGRGIKLVIPPGSSLLAEPAKLYGYESHDEHGQLIPEYKERKLKRGEEDKGIVPIIPGAMPRLAEPPKELLEDIALEEKENPRPEWAKPENRFFKFKVA